MTVPPAGTPSSETPAYGTPAQGTVPSETPAYGTPAQGTVPSETPAYGTPPQRSLAPAPAPAPGTPVPGVPQGTLSSDGPAPGAVSWVPSSDTSPYGTPGTGPGAGPEPLLELESVSRIYGEEIEVYALREVSLKILPGDLMSIVGPSGSGKSTMLGLLGVLDLPTSGTIRIGGQDVSELDDPTRSRLRGESIGFVFQQFHLIPHLTALGNVETALLYRDIRPKERRERAYAALDALGLAARAEHRPVQMSGGEQQRVALARAIVTDPLMILADEPTGALDSVNAALVLDIFKGLESPERAVVMVTHDPGVASTARRKVSMRDGQIVADERRVEAVA